MYKNEFEAKYLNKIAKSTLFYGDNLYLIYKHIENYKKNIKSTNILKQYFKDYDYLISIEYLSQSSLFGGNNLLIIYSDTKIKKKELDNLIKTSYQNKNSYFIYIFVGEDKNAKILHNSFLIKYESIWVRFFSLNINESIKEIEIFSKKLNLSISNENSILLFKKTNNLLISTSELNKLSLLGKKITKEDINNLIFSISNLELEDFSMNLLYKKNNIFIQLKIILEKGETESSIIRYLSFFFNKITLLLTYKKIFNTLNFRDILGYQPPTNIINIYSNIANKLSLTQLETVSEQIIKYSILISKKSDVESNIYIFQFLIFIKKYLKN